LKNNGKVVLFGHKISNKNITEGDRNIPMALKILSKKWPPKSEEQGNIASEKRKETRTIFLFLGPERCSWSKMSSKQICVQKKSKLNSI